jgi:hypothetical protein
MEQNLQQGLDNADFALLARGFEHLKGLVPDPSWNAGTPSWSQLADGGLSAAKSGDELLVRQSCKGCHKAFRSKYKESFRQRVLPR